MSIRTYIDIVRALHEGEVVPFPGRFAERPAPEPRPAPQTDADPSPESAPVYFDAAEHERDDEVDNDALPGLLRGPAPRKYAVTVMRAGRRAPSVMHVTAANRRAVRRFMQKMYSDGSLQVLKIARAPDGA